MVRIEIANPVEIMDVIKQLMADNWAETGFDFELNPSAEMYQRMVDLGIMFVLAAIDDNRVIGYCTMMVAPHLHNPAVIAASNDALFVDKAYRGITSARLIRAAEDEAKRRGASKIMWHTRAGTGLAAMLERRGYSPADVVVEKGL